ncbi:MULTISPECIES: efflux RND transporter periplasmic adaptor subunit [Ramlibacter]|uniref:Efflux RND transporter periplasmic adaptor subunit n=1 Tax=Ramlibacter aquaticus TaxID=2780094 RepID=A0ABR9SKB4_9BURK|nr:MULTISPECIES: efflux RND transporter periplasmic adaptor subunit [Ramlibacter]MBE7942472.1 efflux RND transporter periplasmic adaptor subunit [Ramlibacter aquaticus]
METSRAWLATLRRHGVALSAVVAVVVAAAVWGPGLLLGPEVPVRRVERRDFVQTVVATGRVATPHRTSVGVQLTGTVLRVAVEEGQAVRAGDLLFELESSEMQAAQSQAVLAVRQAQARLRQVRELQAPVAEQALRQAQANLDMARGTLQRNRDLFEKKFIGQAALDDAVRAEQVAQAQARTAQEQLASARPGGSDLAAAQAALAQAEAAAQAAQARLAYTRVRAPVDGTLIARNVEPGDLVQPGKALMVLSPAGVTELVVLIDEKNLHLLRLGQDALASADAYPAERFPAVVSTIDPAVDPQRGSVEVKLRVPRPPSALRQDMTVSVDIEVARRPQALLVAADGVRDPDSAQPWALRVEDGHARRRPLRIGLRSGGWCEVLEGLAAGDAVIPAANGGAVAVREGMRVRVQGAR